MKKLIYQLLAFVALIVLICILATLTSCESRSGHRVPTILPEEKVVILVNTGAIRNDNVMLHNYKVRRIDKGVVAYLRHVDIYSPGDTIIVYSNRFNK